MKVLYFGGQKSGKTSLALAHTKELSVNKPFYIATYIDNYDDAEMKRRVLKHKEERVDRFFTIEEGVELSKVIKKGETYVVDCLSMWILNSMEKEEEYLIKKIEELFLIEANIVFIINDVSRGVIPLDKVSRRFVDLTGIVGQRVAALCDEVYDVNFGIKRRIK